jgi:predicted lipoprotein
MALRPFAPSVASIKHKWDERVVHFQGKAAAPFQESPATNKVEEKAGGAIVSGPRAGKLANGRVSNLKGKVSVRALSCSSFDAEEWCLNQ